MQNTERFRRGVVVPLDDDSASQEVEESTPVHFVEIQSQADFETLWETGFFASVNQELGTLLDHYEEERIGTDLASALRGVAQSYAKRGVGGATGAGFFAAVVEACDVAENTRQPVYFIL